MFIHNVFFWLKEKDNEEARAALLAGIKSLEAIESIESAYIGPPAATPQTGYRCDLRLR